MRIEIKMPEEYKDTEMFYEDGKLNIIDKKWLAEHDKQIRAEIIDEYKLKLLNAQTDLVNDIHKAEVWVEFKRQAIDIAEQLKENK